MVGWETCWAVAVHLLFSKGLSFQPIAHRIGVVRKPAIASPRGLVSAPPPYSYPSKVFKSNKPKKNRHVAKMKRTKDNVKAKSREWKEALRVWWNNTLRQVASWMRFCRRSASRMVFALVLVFALSVNGAWAVSGGRMGGSFGPSSSSSGGSVGSSYSRSYSGSSSSSGSSYSSYSGSSGSSSSSSSSYSWPSWSVYSAPSYDPSPTVVIQRQGGGSSRGAGKEQRRRRERSPPGKVQSKARSGGKKGSDSEQSGSAVTLADKVMLVGSGVVAGGLITYGLFDTLRDSDGGDVGGHSKGPLGTGATVASVTVSLNVPNRDDSKSILSKLKRVSETCDTSTRKGVQDLISEVSLELLRQEKSIVSAKTTAEHFSSAGLAQRQFQRISIQGRSIFDRETVNKFGSEDRSELVKSDKVVNDPFRSTSAIVSLTLAIEGDSTNLPKIRLRSDLMEALSKIASDAQVDDCLLSGEILWAPEDRGEILTSDEIDADYPDLIPL